MEEPSYASHVIPKGSVPDSAVLAGTSAGGDGGGEGLGSWVGAGATEEDSNEVEVGVGVVEASLAPTMVGSAEGVTGGGVGCTDDVGAGVGSGVATKVEEAEEEGTGISGVDTAVSAVVEGSTEEVVALLTISEVEVE